MRSGDKRLLKLKEREPRQYALEEYVAVRNGDSESEDAPYGETREEELLRRTRELNSITREEPERLEVWKELVHHQDKRFSLSKKSEMTQMSEKKVSILEKALGHHPGNSDLLLMLMKERGTIEPPEEHMKTWESVLRQNPGALPLWEEYLEVHKSASDAVAFSLQRGC